MGLDIVNKPTSELIEIAQFCLQEVSRREEEKVSKQKKPRRQFLLFTDLEPHKERFYILTRTDGEHLVWTGTFKAHKKIVFDESGVGREVVAWQYPLFSFTDASGKSRSELATRVAWVLAHQKDLSSSHKLVRTCSCPVCINPSHHT